MNTPNIILSRIVILLSCAGLAYTDSFAQDSLQQFAQQCNDIIGIDIPNFNCDSGTLVRTTHPRDSAGKDIPLDPITGLPIQQPATCDRPNVLNGVCDPGSRFQVLPTSNADAFAVAHCRKEGNNAGFYEDIAVIQHNRTNGATCFYQALADNVGHPLSGDVKTPSMGVGTPRFWMTPGAIAASSFPCAGCHDNGPIIRSPYLSQVEDSNGNKLLPGAGDSSFNRNKPYFFPGHDFADWKVWKVEVEGNTCNGCHRMGVNNLSNNRGTARLFGPMATGPGRTFRPDGSLLSPGVQPSKNPHSDESPIWMIYQKPPIYNLDNDIAAEQIADCGFEFKEGMPLPNRPNCRITPYGDPVLNHELVLSVIRGEPLREFDPPDLRNRQADFCPAGFDGTFTFYARLNRRSESTLLDVSVTDLMVRVQTLTNGNLVGLLDNFDPPRPLGQPRQEGDILPLALPLSDSILRPARGLDVRFFVCLNDRSPFSLFVDVLGIPESP